jgi:hypothetical protein
VGGVCCVAGSCQSGVSQQQCITQGGIWYPLGACCDPRNPAACSLKTRNDCLSDKGTDRSVPSGGTSTLRKWYRGRQCSDVCLNNANSVSSCSALLLSRELGTLRFGQKTV